MWGPWLCFEAKRRPRAKSLGNPALRQKIFFYTTANTKFIFTGIVKFMDIQKCAVRTLAVTPTCRNVTWSTEWFVLIADSKETQFEKIP